MPPISTPLVKKALPEQPRPGITTVSVASSLLIASVSKLSSSLALGLSLVGPVGVSGEVGLGVAVVSGVGALVTTGGGTPNSAGPPIPLIWNCASVVTVLGLCLLG